VPEHHEVVAERSELRCGVGGVDDGETERLRVLAWSDAEVLAADVRVVQAHHLDLQAVQRDRAADVPEVDPAVRFELGHEVGSTAPLGRAVLAALAEILEVVARPGHVIVVRSQHEERGPGPSEVPQGIDRLLDGLRLAHDVSRHHADVAPGQPSQESAHGPRAPREVEVGKVQHRELRGSIRR
jgi:hypothetical protein